MSDSVEIAYDKADLRRVKGALKAMSDEAIIQAKQESAALAEFAKGKIVQAAGATFNKADDRIAQGAKVSKSSKIGELSFGFAGQKFSGGATLNNFGAVMSSDLIDTNNSQSGQASKVEDREAGLFIRHCERYNQSSSLSGKLHSIRY